jgi:hypothetical protein
LPMEEPSEATIRRAVSAKSTMAHAAFGDDVLRVESSAHGGGEGVRVTYSDP